MGEPWGPYYDDPLTGVRILDRETGVIHVAAPYFDGNSAYWWCEGNGSCDCNRMTACGIEYGEEGVCALCYRFLVVGDDGKPKAGWNEGYDLTPAEGGAG